MDGIGNFISCQHCNGTGKAYHDCQDDDLECIEWGYPVTIYFCKVCNQLWKYYDDEDYPQRSVRWLTPGQSTPKNSHISLTFTEEEANKYRLIQDNKNMKESKE